MLNCPNKTMKQKEYNQLIDDKKALEDLYGCLFKGHTPREDDVSHYTAALDTAINLIELELTDNYPPEKD